MIFKAKIVINGTSKSVLIPNFVIKQLGLTLGDEIEIEINPLRKINIPDNFYQKLEPIEIKSEPIVIEKINKITVDPVWKLPKPKESKKPEPEPTLSPLQRALAGDVKKVYKPVK